MVKLLTLPIRREKISCAKFFVPLVCLMAELLVFLAAFAAAGMMAERSAGLSETLPIMYLLKSCAGLFATMQPCAALMWAITIVFEKPVLSVGLNLLAVIPGVLIANTPLWPLYPYCYSGYLVSCAMHEYTAEALNGFSLFPFLPCAAGIFLLAFTVSLKCFGRKEMC